MEHRETVEESLTTWNCAKVCNPPSVKDPSRPVNGAALAFGAIVLWLSTVNVAGKVRIVANQTEF